MNRSVTKILVEENADPLSELTAPQSEPLRRLAFHFPKWQALLIESVGIVLGFVCVVVYDWVFTATISPVLGVIVGATNGSLVAWCVTRSEQVNQDK